MISKYINPFTDFGFKRIFGEEENKDLLIDFLNQLLAPQNVFIKELRYKNTEKVPISTEDRKVIFDLYCENEHGDKFTIELQKAAQENFKDRLLYYSTFSIQEQGKQGPWDYKLKAVYVVAILDFVFDELIRDKVVRNIKLLDIETNEPFTDKLNFITVEMPHFIKEEDDLETNLDKWLYLLKHLYTLKSIPERFKKTILEKVFKIAEYTALSPRAKREYEESLKIYNDLKNTVDTAENKGYKKAEIVYLPQLEEERKLKEEALLKEQEAKQKEQEERKLKEEAQNDFRNLVKMMREMNLSIEDIAQKSNKSEEEIRELLK